MLLLLLWYMVLLSQLYIIGIYLVSSLLQRLYYMVLSFYREVVYEVLSLQVSSLQEVLSHIRRELGRVLLLYYICCVHDHVIIAIFVLCSLLLQSKSRYKKFVVRQQTFCLYPCQESKLKSFKILFVCC